MSVVDLILLVVIAGFVLFGLWFGFIHTLGSLLGTVLAVYLASRYYEIGAEWLMYMTGWEGNITRVIMFVVAFFLISRLVGFLFTLTQKAVEATVVKLPFMGLMNRLLGLVFGFLEGVISVGIILYFIERFPLSDIVMQSIANSELAPYAIAVGSILVPLLPEAVRILESTVDHVEETIINNKDIIENNL